MVVVRLDHHLGSLRRREDGTAAGYDLHASAVPALEDLAGLGAHVVLLTDAADAQDVVSAEAEPWAEAICQDGDLVAAAASRVSDLADTSPEHAPLFVAADRSQRAQARRAGFHPLPHIAAVPAVLEGRTLRVARLHGEVEPGRLGFLLPYEFTRTEAGWGALALMDDRGLARAASLGVSISVLDLDPGVEDPVRLHVDAPTRELAGQLAGHRIIQAEDGVVWLALRPGEAVDGSELHGRHGHLLHLFPRPELLEAPARAGRRAQIVAAHVPERHLRHIPSPERDLTGLLAGICRPDASTFQADVERYSGAAGLDSSGPVASRHVQHPDNDRVVAALLSDLRSIGYCAFTHSFTYGGTTLKSVIADLPARGYLAIDPDLLERLREILASHPDPDGRWRKQVEELLGSNWQDEFGLTNPDPRALRRRLEVAVGLEPWWPWWRLPLCRPPGCGAGIVLLGCHLDSTAGMDAGYQPATDPAPGADDDASGIAAVLAAARSLWGCRGRLTHTVRFAFFNAEEVGLVGSGAYASTLKNQGAPLVAALCADMVGYNSDAHRHFEIHAGYTDPHIRDKSLPVATTVQSQAASQGRLGAGQIYKGTSWPPPGASDRTLYDGAINRSDHASFHAQGYAAAVVSEDFFVNLPSEIGADPNPDYHRKADTTVDASYGAAIACALTAATRELAT